MTRVDVHVPQWARPSAAAAADALAIARALRDTDAVAEGWATALGLALEGGLDEDAALARMNAAVAERRNPAPTVAAIAGGTADALAWLVGLQSRAPMNLPLRHSDGQLMTADDLYAARVQSHWEPERRAAEREQARRDAARSARLAELADRG